MLAIFAGELAQVAIHEPPEALHFGVDDMDGKFSKGLRYPTAGPGQTPGDPFPTGIDSLPFRDRNRRVLDIAGLAAQMKMLLPSGTFTSAEFALQMIEGVERVLFAPAPPSA
jgi:hypothetical protein